MDILRFIIENWDNIAAIVFIVLSILFAAIKRDKETIQEILFDLVTKAEAAYGNNTGYLKRAEVLNSLYTKLPKSIKLFVPKSVLVKWIEEALASARIIWKEKPIILQVLSSIEKTLIE